MYIKYNFEGKKKKPQPGALASVEEVILGRSHLQEAFFGIAPHLGPLQGARRVKPGTRRLRALRDSTFLHMPICMTA